MEIILAFLFQIVGEFLLQIIVEALVEAGFHGLARVFRGRRKRKPSLAALGYLMGGGTVGAITLLIFPSLMIDNSGFRLANLVVTPLLAGLAMAAAGAWRRKIGLDRLRIETFAYGTLFAFGLALVRFVWAA